ncbi:unnamed protein product [Didymodactylos carnosus]|uniref:Uncharacterized protein n=1 Tax=Didymodactylos carnosus TaxID=1234261 RepID=A0A815IRJ9_9BILA|nr:unnamed protein product [Didymodactylos carnosus]CAF4259850.1 unnamed protein product [Didymodactylos carnosus]
MGGVETDKLLQKSLVSDGLINAIKETLLSVDFVGQFCQGIVMSESFMHGISEVIHQRVDMQAKDVQEQLKVANERIVKLTNKLNDTEQYSKRRDLIITGIPMKQREDTTSITVDLTKSLGMKIVVKEIYTTHRLPVRRIDSTQPIIVSFVRADDRQAIYSKRKQLKEMQNYKQVFINEHLTLINNNKEKIG